MGEVRIQVRVQACSLSGNLGARGFRNMTAFVDRGASRTVVSTALAKDLGIRRHKQLGGISGLQAITGVGGVLRVPIGLALVNATGAGCEPQVLVVAISNEITATAKADVILGHDYMQAVPFVVRPCQKSAICEKPRGA